MYAAVSLFSGCGGMDLGAEQTRRVQTVWAVDDDPLAVATYRRNLGSHVVRADIRTLPVPHVPCDILLAGPPCQDFSTLWNHDGAKTARGNLFREVARFLAELRPYAFVLENVTGLLSANRGAAWTIVRHALRAPAAFLGVEAGVRYEVSAEVLDMADLGVPQHRPRLFVLGIRRDLGVRPPEIPKPAAGKHRTVADAFKKLLPRPGRANHDIGLDGPDVIARLKLIPPGKNYTVIPHGHELAVRGLISHVYRRLEPDQPSYTIIANGGGGTHGYHHEEPRRLSNREKARLQTFPDSFIFEGGSANPHAAYPPVRAQIGNAVPPRAARVIIEALAQTLRQVGIRGRTRRELDEARQYSTAWSFERPSRPSATARQR